MKNAGEVLKAERLRKNKTLREISRTTKISMLTLETLEGDHEERHPPATYARGFLRAYAHELELDPEEIISIYDQQLAELQKAAPPKKNLNTPSRIPGYLVPVIVGAVLLLACALYFGYMGRSLDNSRQRTVDTAEQEESQPSARPAEQPAEQPVEQPAEQFVDRQAKPAQPEPPETTVPSAAAAAPKAEPASPAPFTVRFEAGERSWMRFTVDDRHVFDVLLQPGEKYSVNAAKQVKVRIGNPGGLKAFFNDAPIAVPGRPGIPVSMSFPAATDATPAR